MSKGAGLGIWPFVERRKTSWRTSVARMLVELNTVEGSDSAISDSRPMMLPKFVGVMMLPKAKNCCGVLTGKL